MDILQTYIVMSTWRCLYCFHPQAVWLHMKMLFNQWHFTGPKCLQPLFMLQTESIDVAACLK